MCDIIPSHQPIYWRSCWLENKTTSSKISRNAFTVLFSIQPKVNERTKEIFQESFQKKYGIFHNTRRGEFCVDNVILKKTKELQNGIKRLDMKQKFLCFILYRLSLTDAFYYYIVKTLDIRNLMLFLILIDKTVRDVTSYKIVCQPSHEDIPLWNCRDGDKGQYFYNYML